ncbi:RNA-directed DNA polymerase, eukaryota, reverse transcriptase zinc-binding domain protein [Tanacetum coccineum]|uniref:RNA-directed DNA polymerase, eukaryota, reverse transcriptase zinc-binding domain protein n=1 Tax=Tanacetum coccineum TaxID=301880 RepID=A0ABQ5BGS4_9ASTR
MFRVVKDLKALKKPFKRLAWKDGDIFENIKVLRDRLKDVQSKIDVDPSNKVLREEESSILLMYNDAMCDEEQLLFQKAKIKWLSMGDRNNEFFHRVVKSRNHRNRVNAIHDEDGSRFKGDHVAAQFVKYFQNFLGKNVPVCKIDDMGVLFKNKLRPDEAEFMVRDVSNKEIKQAIFLIDDNKAPGPDGFSAYFYKKAWDIIGNDICSASFLEDILRGIGFHDRMVLWIMKCVTTTSFSIIINSESQGYFKGGRGIRQGDPIKLKITHVCFADDLFMISHGDKESVRIMKDSIEEFGKVSGLLPNYNKSTIVFGSVKEKDRRDLLEVVPFKVEKLPIKYLGFWSLFMYIGPLFVFLLPQAIIDEINSLLKGFLWNQEKKANGRAKDAWKSLCKPKSQGGLGLKNLSIWNKALISKHQWHVAVDKDSLWVKWINTYKLKGRSIWEVNEEINDSWGWRNILKMRQLVKEAYIQKNCEIGNVIVQHDRVDQLMWRSKSGTLSKFSVKQAYYDIRNDEDQVRWSKLVWFSQNILKHAFILWLAILGRLTTQDKIRSWGSYDLMVCPLCCNEMDSHEHLFFQCEYSSSLWGMCADMQNGKSLNSIVRRLCLAASVYFIWQERNSRIFRDEKRKVKVLFKALCDTIKLRLYSLKVKATKDVINIRRPGKSECTTMVISKREMMFKENLFIKGVFGYCSHTIHRGLQRALYLGYVNLSPSFYLAGQWMGGSLASVLCKLGVKGTLIVIRWVTCIWQEASLVMLVCWSNVLGNKWEM